MFPSLVVEALRIFPAVRWLVFAGPDQAWPVEDERVEVVRRFPANDRPLRRLWADHFAVSGEAARRGAGVLLTVGFVPVRGRLPVVMHIVTLHHQRATNDVGRLRRVYRDLALRSGLQRAALLVTNSQWAADELCRLAPDARHRLIVSPEGVDHSVFSPAAPAGERERLTQELRIPPRYLLWVSNFYPYKRAALALAAFAALPPELRARNPLVLAGGDWQGGLARARWEAARLGVERDTRFLGWVDDGWLPALYRHARAHISASAEETFGRNVLEAMACGCPNLLQDLPVLREVTGGAAWLTDFVQQGIAADALREMCVNDATTARLRTQGIVQAGRFSFVRLARERLAAILPLLVGCSPE